MSSFQQYVAIGTLGRDPEIRSTPSGVKVASFSVAINEGYGDKQRVEWVNCICFKDRAEFAEKYLKKGKSVSLTGKLKTSSWDDKTTGKKVYKTEIEVRDLNFFNTQSSEGGSSSSRTAAPTTRAETPIQTRSTQPVPSHDPFANDDLDEIPF